MEFVQTAPQYLRAWLKYGFLPPVFKHICCFHLRLLNLDDTNVMQKDIDRSSNVSLFALQWLYYLMIYRRMLYSME